METQELKDIQALINMFFPFAEELLIKYGEFYPYAGATTVEGEFVSVGYHKENEFQESQKVMTNLKNALQQGSTAYIAVAIFYNVRTKDNETGETEDAIAVFVEHKDGYYAYEFFYPYRLEDKENFIVDDSFGNTIPKEIFNPAL